jgi:hypothetical protein
MEMLSQKLQALSRMIFDITSFPLFVEVPAAEISSVEKHVTDEDSFRARLTDLSNLLDRINKKQIDKTTGVSSAGSRDSFVILLKYLIKDEHAIIDEHVGTPLGMILLTRGYSTHRKNKNISRALAFFDIEDIAIDYVISWEKIIHVFNGVIDMSLELLSASLSKSYYKQQEIDESLREIMNVRLLNRYGHLLSTHSVKQVLLCLLSEKLAVDTWLAERFGMEIGQLRKLLLPLIPHIVKASYNDRASTKIAINKNAAELIMGLYFPGGASDNKTI